MIKNIMIFILFSLGLFISNVGCIMEFSGLICKNGDIFGSNDICTDCTRDPNKYYDCAKIIAKRVADNFYEFLCYTSNDLELGTGPTKIQQLSVHDGYNNIKVFCELSIPKNEILFYVKHDECIVQKVLQPYDCDWYSTCLEKDFSCGSLSFPMRYGNAYCTKLNRLVTEVSNEAQYFFQYFNKCLKGKLAEVYFSKDGNCDMINKISSEAYLYCFKQYGLCAMIERFDSYPGFFPSLAKMHNLQDKMAASLLKSLLTESKSCGDKTYLLLKRMWKGLVSDDALLFLE
jgi:hypothetical protein